MNTDVLVVARHSSKSVFPGLKCFSSFLDFIFAWLTWKTETEGTWVGSCCVTLSCASLGSSWLHVSFLSLLRWVLSFFSLDDVGIRTCLGLSGDIASLLRDWLLAGWLAASETLNLASSSKTWSKCSQGRQAGVCSVWSQNLREPGAWRVRVGCGKAVCKRIPCSLRGRGF